MGEGWWGGCVQERESSERMKDEKYSLSFTTGGLFHSESVKLTELFLQLHAWNLVRDLVLSENLLQARTIASSKRVCREIIARLETLNHEELDLLVGGTLREQAYLLWLAVCRRYRLIAEFAEEVIRERYISFRTDLGFEDFEFFLNKKSEWHAELDELKPSTREKLRQVLFKILRETDILTPNNTINGATLSPLMQSTISETNPRELLVFPMFDSNVGSE